MILSQRSSWLIGAWLVACPSLASAQDSWFRRFLAPNFGDDTVQARFRSEASLREGTDQRDTSMHLNYYELDLLVPVAATADDEWIVTMQLSDFRVDGSAVLPGTGSLLGRPDALPGELWDVRFGAGYRRRLDNDWIAGGQFSLGSASDELFATIDEYAVMANLFLRIPAEGDDAWMLLLNYNNTRQFLSEAPIPGFAYLWNRGPDFRATLGVPYSSLYWRPGERWNLQVNYLLPRVVYTRAGFALLDNLEIYAGYEWGNRRYLRAGRAHDDDLLFFFEQRVLGGVRWDVNERTFVDFAAGYAFDRFFFEGEDYGDRGQHRVEMDDGPWFRLQVAVRL